MSRVATVEQGTLAQLLDSKVREGDLYERLADGAVLSAAVSALRDWRQCRVRRVTSVPEPVEAPTP